MPLHALAMVLGSLLALYGNQLPDQSWLAVVPILLWLFYCNPAYRFVLLFMSAYLWSSAILHYHLDHRLADSYDHQIALVQGTVSGIPQIKPGRIGFYLQIHEIAGYSAPLPRLARINWYQDERVPLPGELWQLQVKLKQPRAMLNFAGFDFEAWQFKRGIDASGYVRASKLNLKLEPASWRDLDQWRSYVAAAIDRYCAGCENRGLIKALALGFRGDIKASQTSLLQTTGTAHLLAISGLHIGMVSFLFYGLGRFGWRLGLYRSGLNRVQLASLCALLAALGYSALAGFSLPTLRALLMFGVFLCAQQNRSRINLLQSIALAMMLILVLDPRVVGSVSFWLSFAALLVIAFAGFRLPAKLRWWQQLFLLQCLFSLLFAPLSVLIFGQLNPAGLLANVVAIPLISFAILPLVLCACLMILLGIGGVPKLLYLADRILGYFIDYLDLLVDSGLRAITGVYPEMLVLMVLVSILILLIPGVPGGRKVALLALLVMTCWQPERLDQGDFELVVLDVGMGTSLVIRTRNHSLVYDLGPGRPDGFNASDWALRPLMLKNGIKQPDLLVISHVDQDHSGGFYSLIDEYQPSRLLSGTPNMLKEKFKLGHAVRSCHDFPAWRWDGVAFSFLNAGLQRPNSSSNNRSCVLSVRGFHRLLVPGDIESAQESRLLLTQADNLASDILLVPHHGSKTSSSWGFLKQIKPRHVVFTLARNNRWGFPRPQIVARYEALRANQYRLDQEGAISMLSSRDGLVIKSARRPSRRIWRRW
ncbi:MAG: DNA internalization-related competence protein ComEC/Rec2 [Gammaproteobacteria bacterium]|nr:DNA internalization-related competence protein ComEC/Rec2 [Gammaproteobacteria bacterium]